MNKDNDQASRLFLNEEDMRLNNMRDTLEVARINGFDVFEDEGDGKMLCGKHSTSLVVRVYPDGSWEFEDTTPENPAAHDITNGINASFLRLFFHDSAAYLKADKDEA